MLEALKSYFLRDSKRIHPSALRDMEKGLLAFQHTGEVIRAEQILRKSGFDVEVKAPPAALRTGCDMIVVFPLLREAAVLRVLDNAGLHPVLAAPVHETLLEPVSLCSAKDYGAWLMVQAANVKITVEKHGGTIVNVSGGGCPDVPWLSALLVGQNIFTVEEPRLHGQTLCSYALQKAFDEARRLLAGQKEVNA